MVRLVLIIASALLLSGGCRADRSPAPTATPPLPADSAKLPPVSLPDLSRLEISVQQQIRERYRSLTSMDVTPGIPATDRAVAHGEMGRLLMAAENFDAAEPFYLHAQALAPDDMRWPYYLGHVYMARAQPDKAVASFERARRLRPDDVATLVWLGDVHLDQGRPEQAEPLFAQALAAQPRGVAALFGLWRAALA